MTPIDGKERSMATARDDRIHVYSLRDRIDEYRVHTPARCLARLELQAQRERTSCRFGERQPPNPRSTGRLVV